MSAVPTKDVLVKHFVKFLTAWDAELQTENKRGFNDINKSSEGIALEIMNAIYGYELVQETKVNSAGFDLCCTKNQVLVQITSNCTLKKITECLRTTCARIVNEPHLKDFELYILFLTTDRTKIDNLRGKIAAIIKNDELNIDTSDIVFFPKTHILDFKSFIEELDQRTLTKDQMAQLQAVLDQYLTSIDFNAEQRDRVQEIIDLYIDNFEAPLFMHRGSQTVTLKNLYVEPDFTDPKYAASIPALLEDFIWNQGREKILLIEGSAAIGKTSLVSWMCWHHAHPTEDSNLGQQIFRGHPIVVVRLRELEFPNQMPSSSSIVRYLKLTGTKAFFDDYPNAILILDGADELGLVSNVKTHAIEDFILDVQQALGPYKLIVTSRPQFLKVSNLKSFLFDTRHITLEHFSRDKRAQWVENYKATGEALAPETEEYILNISDKDADGVADTPLALYLLADCRMQEDYKNNQWALYHAIFSEAITKAPYNTGSSPLMSAEHAAQNYDMVKAIAFRMFRNSGSERFYITKEELDEIAHSIGLTDVDAERVKETCVLCAYWKNNNAGALEFYHNNIRDFFLAEYFCDTLAQAFGAIPVVSGQGIQAIDGTIPTWNLLMKALSELFSWVKIAGSNWNQVFAFITLRLLAESQQPTNSVTLYSRFTKNPALLRLTDLFANSPALWSQRDCIHPYQAAKAAFSNVLIIFNILLRYIPDLPSNTYPVSYSDMSIALLRDWPELFMERVFLPNLDNMDLLRNCTLKDTDWRDKILSNPHLSNSIMNDGSLFGACLRNSIVSNTKFNYTHFTQSRIYYGRFSQVTIDNSDFSGSRFSKCIFNDCQIAEANFKGARIYYGSISNSVFLTAYLAGVKLTAEMNNVRYMGCHFINTTISQTQLKDVVFVNCDFSHTAITKASLTNCRIEGPYTYISDIEFTAVTTKNCTFRDVTPETADILRSLGFTEEA